MIKLDINLEEYTDLFSSAPQLGSDPELEEDPELPCSCEDCKHYDPYLYRCKVDCCIIAVQEANDELIGQTHLF